MIEFLAAYAALTAAVLLYAVYLEGGAVLGVGSLLAVVATIEVMGWKRKR